jgi:hypothetical protein
MVTVKSSTLKVTGNTSAPLHVTVSPVVGAGGAQVMAARALLLPDIASAAPESASARRTARAVPLTLGVARSLPRTME